MLQYTSLWEKRYVVPLLIFVKATSSTVAEAKKWRNTEVVERAKAKVLAIRNTRKALVFPSTAKPSWTLPFWLYPPGTVKAAVKLTVAMSVATNILVSLTRFQQSDSDFPSPLASPSPASFGLLLGFKFRMPIFMSAPLRLCRAPFSHNSFWISSCKIYKWMIFFFFLNAKASYP